MVAIIGQLIEKKRRELNMTQEDLADKVGVSRITIYKWENSITKPKTDKLKKLTQALNLSIKDLIE